MAFSGVTVSNPWGENPFSVSVNSSVDRSAFNDRFVGNTYEGETPINGERPLRPSLVGMVIADENFLLDSNRLHASLMFRPHLRGKILVAAAV